MKDLTGVVSTLQRALLITSNYLLYPQMTLTCVLGCLQMYYPLGMALENDSPKGAVQTKPKEFWKNMFVVGSMRFSTVLLGIVLVGSVACNSCTGPS